MPIAANVGFTNTTYSNKNVTESFHEYKGYIIKLRAVTYNGFWYKIIKQVPSEKSPNGIKNMLLRERGWNFIKPALILQKAKDYIDQFPTQLEEKFQRLCKEKNINYEK